MPVPPSLLELMFSHLWPWPFSKAASGHQRMRSPRAPTRDFLHGQEAEAQLRGKGLFLCELHTHTHTPTPLIPLCSSRVLLLLFLLLHDPCFVSGIRQRASIAPAPRQEAWPAFVYATEVLSPSAAARFQTSGKRESPCSPPLRPPPAPRPAPSSRICGMDIRHGSREKEREQRVQTRRWEVFAQECVCATIDDRFLPLKFEPAGAGGSGGVPVLPIVLQTPAKIICLHMIPI